MGDSNIPNPVTGRPSGAASDEELMLETVSEMHRYNIVKGVTSGPLDVVYRWKAEELDIPVGVHTGLGPAGTPYTCCPKFRVTYGNPVLLEEVLVKHPKSRLYIMHGGWPYLEETKARLDLVFVKRTDESILHRESKFQGIGHSYCNKSFKENSLHNVKKIATTT
jgi:hypothetical protein